MIKKFLFLLNSYTSEVVGEKKKVVHNSIGKNMENIKDLNVRAEQSKSIHVYEDLDNNDEQKG